MKEQTKLQVIKIHYRIADDLWEHAQEKFRYLGVSPGAPGAVDLFGNDHYERILNQHRRAIYDNRDKLVKEVLEK